MKRKLFALLFAIVLVCSFSACVRIDAKVKINSNGTADLSILYAVSDVLTSLGGDSGLISFEEINEYKAKGITYEAYSDSNGGYKGYILTREGLKIQTTDKKETGMDSFIDGDFFTVDGNHVILSFVPISEDEYSESGSSFDMIKSYDGYMYFTVELPVKPTNHNATSISDDGKTLTWDLTLFKANDKLYAEFDLPSNSFPWWILLAAGAVIVAVVVVLAIVLKKRKAKKGTATNMEVQTAEPTAYEEANKPMNE